MQSITVRNVNHALPLALALLRDKGKAIAPRGNPTKELVGPFATTYQLPEEMVLFDPVRDANPFFHFFEALWILEGRQDVGFLAHFLPRMADFSDNGKTFHAPYGYRLRTAYGFDQIEIAIEKLSKDHDTRQAVLSIWDPRVDWERTKDVPCNDMIMLKIRDGKLRMTVCNRSNDAVLGAYGANVVQFSTLQIYIAGRVGVGVGEYTQISDSFHVYEDNPFWKHFLETQPAGVPPVNDPYEARLGSVQSFLTANDDIESGDFDADLKKFFRLWDAKDNVSKLPDPGMGPWVLDANMYTTDSFTQTVIPMLECFSLWKHGDRRDAVLMAESILALDWRAAAAAWMHRRLAKEGL